MSKGRHFDRMYLYRPAAFELDHLPPEARWREWMARVEAVIFAASEPVTRETLSRIVGRDCSIDLLIDDIREELRGRPYDLVTVAGGAVGTNPENGRRPQSGRRSRAAAAPAGPR